MDDYTVLENETAYFQCAFNKPNLRVRWKRNNRDISNSDKYLIRVENEAHFLEIMNSELKDEAEYSCDASEAKTSAKLLVKGKSYCNTIQFVEKLMILCKRYKGYTNEITYLSKLNLVMVIV